MAYLVIRDGESWSTIFQLIPGKTTTIGRASTNQIVLSDDRCSRTHAEVYYNSGDWYVRDLNSRNGTSVSRIMSVNPEIRNQNFIVAGHYIYIPD